MPSRSLGGVGAFNAGIKTMGGHIEQNPWKPTVRRGPIAAEYGSPGPASVQLPSYIGSDRIPESGRRKSPAFTMAGRHDEKPETSSPGPKFNVTGLSRTGPLKPKGCSISGRPEVRKQEESPGPGAYGRDVGRMHTLVHPSPLKFSFGIRPNIRVGEETPGSEILVPSQSQTERLHSVAPNTYSISGSGDRQLLSDKPSTASFTIRGRPREIKHEQTPGPGAYDEPSTDVYKQKSPSYSISYRTSIPIDRTIKPGPASHYPEKVILDSTPRYSFGIRHSPYVSYNKKDFQLPPKEDEKKAGEEEEEEEEGLVSETVGEREQPSADHGAPTSNGTWCTLEEEEASGSREGAGLSARASRERLMELSLKREGASVEEGTAGFSEFCSSSTERAAATVKRANVRIFL